MSQTHGSDSSFCYGKIRELIDPIIIIIIDINHIIMNESERLLCQLIFYFVLTGPLTTLYFVSITFIIKTYSNDWIGSSSSNNDNRIIFSIDSF